MNTKIYKKIFLFLILTLLIISCKPRAIRKFRRHKDISMAKILLKKELVIGIDDNQPPFSFIDEDSGKPDGYDIDIASEVGKQIGVNVIFKTVKNEEKDRLLQNEELDCLWSCFAYTPERDNRYTLAEPLIRTAVVFAVMDSSEYTTLEQLKDKNIGVHKTSAIFNSLKRATDMYGGFNNLVFFDNYDLALEAMETGKVDTVVHDLLVLNTYIRSNLKPYRIINEAIDAHDYVIAFRKNEIALKDRIEDALYALAKKGVLENTSKKWFGVDISLIGR